MANDKTKKDQAQKKTAPSKGGKVSEPFKKAIKAYLDKRAAEDELFAKTYAKENKNLDDCCNYILQQVRISGRQGFADEEIYSMAMHYYDEDDIKDVKPVNAVKVVVNHVVEQKRENKEPKRTEAPKSGRMVARKKQSREVSGNQHAVQLSLFDM